MNEEERAEDDATGQPETAGDAPAPAPPERSDKVGTGINFKLWNNRRPPKRKG